MSKFRVRGQQGPAQVPGKLPNGKFMCRWCKGPVEPPKRTFCGPDCVHEWRLRSDTEYLRTQVFARDKGICSKCGVAALALRQELRKLQRENRDEWLKAIEAHQLTENQAQFSTLWEADHINPVVEGGGLCGLANMQTLCVKHHKEKTTAEAKERALKRKDGKVSS